MTHDLLIKIMELSRRVLSPGSGIRNAKSIAKAIVNKYDCFCVHFCIFNEKNANLTEDEKVIYKLLSTTMMKPISEIAPYIPFGKSKATKLLQEMGQKGVIAIEGKGRGTKYKIK